MPQFSPTTVHFIVQLVKAAGDAYSEDGICNLRNRCCDECGTVDASRLTTASKKAAEFVFSDLQGQAADSHAEQIIDKQHIPRKNHEPLDRAGQIIASLQVVLPLIGRIGQMPEVMSLVFLVLCVPLFGTADECRGYA